MNRKSEPRTALRMLFLLPAMAGLASCVNEAYDPENINTEITVAQSGLAIPVGSTKQLKVKDLIKDLDGDILSQINGEYAIQISDKMSLADKLPDLKEMLKIDDISIDESFEFAIDAFDKDDLTIAGQTILQDISFGNDIDANVEIPPFSADESISLGLYDYAKKIKDIDLSSSLTKASLSTTVAFNLPVVPVYVSSKPFPDDEKSFDRQQTDINISFNSPDAKITNIRDLKMTGNSKMEIKVSVTGHEFLTSGDIVPDIRLDLGELFGLKDNTGRTAAMPLSLSKVLNSSNNYTSVYEYSVGEININAANWSGTTFSQNNTISAEGKIGISNATTSGTAINEYAGDGLHVSIDISFKNMAVESATMDISNITVSESVNMPISLGDGIELPDHVKSIDKIEFTESSAISLALALSNVKDPNLNVQLKSLNMKFPERITVDGTAGKSYSFQNINIRNGFSRKFSISEMSLPAPDAGKIEWNDNVEIKASITASGKGVNTAKFPTAQSEESSMTAKISSNLDIADWSANVEGFDVDFDTFKEVFSFDVDASLANYGEITIHPEGTPRFQLVITMPDMSMGIVPGSENIKVSFPDFIVFKKASNASYEFDYKTNTLTFKNALPKTVALDIEKLVVTPQPKETSKDYEIRGEFKIEGNIGIQEGKVSGKDLETIGKTGIKVQAIIPEITAKTLDINEFKIDINEAFRATLIKGKELPDDINIISLSEASLDNTTAKFDIKLSGLPDVGENKDINVELNIALPKELVLAEDSRVKDNILTIKGVVDRKDGSIDIAPITLAAIDLSDYDFEKREDLTEDIKVSGKFSISNPNIDLSTVTGTVTADIKAGIENIAFKKVAGKIDYSVEESSETISLNDIPDMLKGEDFNLDFDNPYITLKAKTNMGIPLKGDISIIPVRGGADDESGKINLSLNIDGAENAAEKDSVMYFIAAKKDGCPADYTFVKSENIKTLLSHIPDELKLSFNAGTDSSKDCVIEPSADYMFDVEYAFICPLSFGEDLMIEISDTIKGFDETIAKVLKDNTIQIGGEITNSLPLQLELNLELLDENDKVVKLETPAKQVIAPCKSNGNASVSQLDLKLETAASVKNTISSIKLSFKVTSGNVSGIAVTEDMFVQANLKLLLPDGITIDLKDLK
ncbi:MAG: DUF4621 domain-containing protein [Candidatus Cryptobacteroides sp.]